MKTSTVILAMVFLLALCQASHAADLQAGWYVNNLEVTFDLYDPVSQEMEFGDEAILPIDTGQYGPFTVAFAPNEIGFALDVSVPTTTYGVTPDESLIVPLYFTSSTEYGYIVTQFFVSCDTNYDSSAMLLDLWHQDTDGYRELILSQVNSGMQYFYSAPYNEYRSGSYFFEVAVAPEPTGILSLVFGLIAVGFCRRRRV